MQVSGHEADQVAIWVDGQARQIRDLHFRPRLYEVPVLFQLAQNGLLYRSRANESGREHQDEKGNEKEV